MTLKIHTDASAAHRKATEASSLEPLASIVEQQTAQPNSIKQELAIQTNYRGSDALFEDIVVLISFLIVGILMIIDGRIQSKSWGALSSIGFLLIIVVYWAFISLIQNLIHTQKKLFG